jgi:hypothetical protein
MLCWKLKGGHFPFTLRGPADPMGQNLSLRTVSRELAPQILAGWPEPMTCGCWCVPQGRHCLRTGTRCVVSSNVSTLETSSSLYQCAVAVLIPKVAQCSHGFVAFQNERGGFTERDHTSITSTTVRSSFGVLLSGLWRSHTLIMVKNLAGSFITKTSSKFMHL